MICGCTSPYCPYCGSPYYPPHRVAPYYPWPWWAYHRPLPRPVVPCLPRPHMGVGEALARAKAAVR